MEVFEKQDMKQSKLLLSNKMQLSLPWACHLVLVVELVCLNGPKGYAGGDLVIGGFNCTGLVKGKRPDKGQALVLQTGGWALG